MPKARRWWLLWMPLALVACERTAGPVANDAADTPRAAVLRDVRVTQQALALPAPVGAAQPDLVTTAAGGLLLSWIEPQGDGHALKWARLAGSTWSAPQTIAAGTGWFVNWADTPHLAITGDGALWAHWLQKSAAARYAYDVALVRSADGGVIWSRPVLVNDDGKAAEHGFVSLWPATRDALGVTWLDGRNSDGGEHAGHPSTGSGQAGHAGAMTLRAARFDANLQRSGETEIDAMTCDCCQTDIAGTARGPLLVYRDRSHEEIRDIAVTRLQGDAWTAPRTVHADGWKMPACPVNGPAVAARGNEAVVAWYTAAGDVPTLKLARSTDAGDSFAAPRVLDRGDAVQGRVDVALGEAAVWVTWLREDAQGQSLLLARYTPNLARELQRVEVAKLRGRGRATGFPQLAISGDAAYLVWTDVVDGRPRLQGARYRLPP